MSQHVLSRLQFEQAMPWHIDGARAIQEAVLPPEHPYLYWQNIGGMGTFNLVAMLDGQVVGYISCLVGQPSQGEPTLWRRARPYIGFVGVLPEWQNHGIGPQLVRTLVRVLRENLRITETIWLECKPDGDGREQRAYLRAGFELVPPEDVWRRFELSSPAQVMRCPGSDSATSFTQ